MFKPIEFRRGQRLAADALNEIVSEAERLTRVTAEPPLYIREEKHAGMNVTVDLPEVWWIKLTGGGTSGQYSWTRQIPVAGGTWANHPGGQTGTAGGTDPAYEQNGNTTVNLSPNPIVRAWRDPNSQALLFLAGSC